MRDHANAQLIFLLSDALYTCVFSYVYRVCGLKVNAWLR